MNAIADFYFYCRTPAKRNPLVLGEGTDLVRIEGIPTYTGLPPWPSCADVLHTPGSNELLGLSYYVAPPHLKLVARTARGLDPASIRLLDPDSAEMWERYPQEYGKNGRLEVRWRPNVPAAVYILQLMEPLWYYSLGSDETAHGELVGIGVGGMDDLLAQYSLFLPPAEEPK